MFLPNVSVFNVCSFFFLLIVFNVRAASDAERGSVFRMLKIHGHGHNAADHPQVYRGQEKYNHLAAAPVVDVVHLPSTLVGAPLLSLSDGSISPQELDALYALYNATNGTDWQWGPVLTSGPEWDFTTTNLVSPVPCKDSSVWQGLNCTCPPSGDQYCIITGLALNAYGLDGSLPATIGGLTNLKTLDLSYNVLIGSIPSLDSLCQLLSLDLDSNSLTGSIPSLDNLSQLQSLDLHINALTGPIPSLDNLSQLQYLYLSGNALTGSIPSLKNLSHLQYVYMYSNALTGSIPSLDSLGQLQFLQLYFNSLTGSIPSLDALSKLQYLDLHVNALTGSIPSLDSLDQLRQLELYSNALTGSIPALDSLSQLQDLGLYNNDLTGSIPSLDSLIELLYLGLYNNDLTGSIPSLNSLSQLQELYLFSNALTGSIPSLDSLKQLQFFYLDSNALTGSIPSLDSLSQLQSLDLDSNSLTGFIPSLDNLSQLQYLYMYNNALTGSIPSLDSLSQLLYLDFYLNALIGSIPSLDSLIQLQYLYMYNNVLTGSIPSLDSLSQLKYLDLHINALSGSMPSLDNVPLILTVQVQNNRLSGKLNGIVCPETHVYLHTMQLSSNQFSGTIPAQIFELPALQTFAIVSNCMRGPLPLSTICNSSSLRSLLLDGLHTASSCRTPVFGGLIPRLYVLDRNDAYLSDQLDPCLFSIPTLHTLHMSGNGLTGSIPDVSRQDVSRQESNGTSIVNLVLSYNELTGTIPLSLQRQEWWTTLDLSYNRLSGVLRSEFTSSFENKRQSSINLNLNRTAGLIPEFLDLQSSINLNLNRTPGLIRQSLEQSSISLNLNRLSGPIPQSLNKAENITILSGNIFSCNIDGSNLPVHDKERSDYSCGSNAFNVPYYAWLAFVCFAVLTFLVASLLYTRKVVSTTTSIDSNHRTHNNICTMYTILRRLESVTSLQQAAAPQHLRRVEQLLDGIRRFVTRCWVYILIVLVPLYIACGAFSSTYIYRYAWTVSTSFLTGSTTAGLLFSALAVYIVFLAVQYNTLVFSMPMRTATSLLNVKYPHSKKIPSTHQRIVYALPWLTIIIVNVLIVGLSNVGFVWVSVYHGSRLNLFAVQVALAVVKYIWNSKLLRLTIHWFVSLVNDLSVSIVSERALAVELHLSVFNNVVIPCFVVAVVDPDCFYTFLVPPKKVTAEYEYSGWKCIENICATIPLVSTTSFDPPFSYSYQCSASFTTHYATAFLYLCIVTGVAVPLWELCIMYLYSTQLSLDRLLASPTASSSTTTSFSSSQSSCVGTTSAGATHSTTATADAASATTTTTTAAANAATTTTTSTFTTTGDTISPLMTITSREARIEENTDHAITHCTGPGSTDGCNIKLGSSNSSIVSASTSTSNSTSTADTRKPSQVVHRLLLDSGVVPRLLRPVPLTPISNNDPSSAATTSISSTSSTIITTRSCTTSTSCCRSGMDSKPAPKQPAPFFDATEYLSTVIILLALLLTFGTVFPPLGFAIVVTLVVYTYITQFKLARFITLSEQAGLLSQVVQIDHECRTFVLPSEQGVWVLVTVACWFYAFILFDTLGDTAGLDSALCILSAMALMPLALYIGDRLLLCWYARHDNKKDNDNEPNKQQRVAAGAAGTDAVESNESGAVEMGRMTLWAHAHMDKEFV